MWYIISNVQIKECYTDPEGRTQRFWPDSTKNMSNYEIHLNENIEIKPCKYVFVSVIFKNTYNNLIE